MEMNDYCNNQEEILTCWWCWTLKFWCHLPGTKHFLLMCGVKPEDSGEIRFVARDVESTAFLEVEGKSEFIFQISLLFDSRAAVYLQYLVSSS